MFRLLFYEISKEEDKFPTAILPLKDETIEGRYKQIIKVEKLDEFVKWGEISALTVNEIKDGYMKMVKLKEFIDKLD